LFGGSKRDPRYATSERFILYFIGAGLGLIAGMIAWFSASHWLATSILWFEARYPRLVGSKSLRIYEVVFCGLLVLGCFAIAFWIMLLVTR
jgi:hypothetical protein